MKTIFKRKIISFGIITVAALSITLTPLVRAQENQTPPEETPRPTMQERRETRQTMVEERTEQRETRLTEVKLLACEKRQTAITNIMTRMGDRGDKRIVYITTINERVQAFYTERSSTVDSYDALVTATNEAKEAAQSAVDATAMAAESFSCDSEDPKGLAQAFKSSLQAQIEALQLYRESVKNLIVAVKSAQATTQESSEEQE